MVVKTQDRETPRHNENRQLKIDRPTKTMKLSIIVPVYNEKQTILEILQRIDRTPYDKEIVVIDDFSKDGTRDILRELEAAAKIPSVRVLYHEVNQGKGAALRTG